MAEWRSVGATATNTANNTKKTYQMPNTDIAARKRKRIEGTANTPTGLLSTFTPPRLKSPETQRSSALQQLQKSYSNSDNSKREAKKENNTCEDLFPFYKTDEMKPTTEVKVARNVPQPREPLHTKPTVPFLKTPPDQDPVPQQRIVIPDEQRHREEQRPVTNPILNKPIDGAPTRRPKVPKEEGMRTRQSDELAHRLGSTADNAITLDSSEDESENSNGQDIHQWCISAAHIGSLTKLDVTILEINQEHFEFNIQSDVLLAEVKVCVPWDQVIKMETHFSNDLSALVMHVEERWATDLITQLKAALSRQMPLELDPKSPVIYKRVISLEFVREPPPAHLHMMGYYLDKYHSVKMNRIESKTSAYIKELLPPINHNDSHMDTDVIEQDTRTLLKYPPPPAQATITLTYADLECLKPEEFLNDSIIDFYLKYIHHELVSDTLKQKTHMFNSFFYKALTQPVKKETKRDPTAKKLTASEKMHSQVKNWSKSIDLFSKDYIIVPINEHQHWYLAIICYPWLEAPVYSDSSTWKPAKRGLDREEEIDEKDIDGVLSKNREHNSVPPITCRPCILMFDSLVANGRNRVVNNLRNYLSVEWRTKGDRGVRNFTKNNFPGIFVEGPLQENFCDCGVFLLQFVEKIFESPITDYRFPVERKDWFSQQDITRKREYLRKLIVQLGPNRQFAGSSSDT